MPGKIPFDVKKSLLDLRGLDATRVSGRDGAAIVNAAATVVDYGGGFWVADPHFVLPIVFGSVTNFGAQVAKLLASWVERDVKEAEEAFRKAERSGGAIPEELDSMLEELGRFDAELAAVKKMRFDIKTVTGRGGDYGVKFVAKPKFPPSGSRRASAHLASLWLRRVAGDWDDDDEEDEPRKKVPAGPWTSRQVLDIFSNSWDYGIGFTGRRSLTSPTPKDEQGVANLLEKSRGNAQKFLQLVMQSVNRIKSADVAMRRAIACSGFVRNPNQLQYIYDRDGSCVGDRCIPYVQGAKEGMQAAEQVYYYRALSLAGARYVKMPALAVSPPPKPQKVKWSPPPIPSGAVPTTVDGWQLYDTPGAKGAARKLSRALATALKMLGRNVSPHNSAKKNVAAVDKLFNRMTKIRDTYDDFGAADTEGRYVVKDAFEKYLMTYLDKWDHKAVFDAVYDAY